MLHCLKSTATKSISGLIPGLRSSERDLSLVISARDTFRLTIREMEDVPKSHNVYFKGTVNSAGSYVSTVVSFAPPSYWGACSDTEEPWLGTWQAPKTSHIRSLWILRVWLPQSLSVSFLFLSSVQTGKGCRHPHVLQYPWPSLVVVSPRGDAHRPEVRWPGVNLCFCYSGAALPETSYLTSLLNILCKTDDVKQFLFHEVVGRIAIYYIWIVCLVITSIVIIMVIIVIITIRLLKLWKTVCSSVNGANATHLLSWLSGLSQSCV